ncbi:MAG: alpha/beta hydrolase, partial [Actinobacteria bacterium]|nr:alpha/beta hydrolase [Actinomycetota bacterium]
MMLPRLLAPRLPVWLWRAAMSAIGPLERRRFERGASRDVVVETDIDYGGRGCVEQRLDVIVPLISADRPAPVYVYFHGGGWTSGSKRTVGSYCAAQAEAGLVVVNVEYRKAPKATMSEMLRDGTAALAWVVDHIAEFNGDPHRVVLGGDSAGGQLAGLL